MWSCGHAWLSKHGTNVCLCRQLDEDILKIQNNILMLCANQHKPFRRHGKIDSQEETLCCNSELLSTGVCQRWCHIQDPWEFTHFQFSIEEATQDSLVLTFGMASFLRKEVVMTSVLRKEVGMASVLRKRVHHQEDQCQWSLVSIETQGSTCHCHHSFESKKTQRVCPSPHSPQGCQPRGGSATVAWPGDNTTDKWVYCECTVRPA